MMIYFQGRYQTRRRVAVNEQGLVECSELNSIRVNKINQFVCSKNKFTIDE